MVCLLQLAGLALIVVGAVVQSKFNQHIVILDSKFNAAAILLIVVGVIVFVIGFFGCCGACKEHYCMTITVSLSRSRRVCVDHGEFVSITVRSH